MSKISWFIPAFLPSFVLITRQSMLSAFAYTYKQRLHPLVQIYTQRNRVPNIISRISNVTVLQIYSGNFFRRFPMVTDGFPWLSMVIDGYRGLSLVQIYSKSSAHLQLSFPSFAEVFCSTRPDKLIVDNRR